MILFSFVAKQSNNIEQGCLQIRQIQLHINQPIFFIIFIFIQYRPFSFTQQTKDQLSLNHPSSAYADSQTKQ